MASRCNILISLLVVSVIHLNEGARILAVCPTLSVSHQNVFRGLTMALNDRGHELVVVTSDPVNDANRKNYTEIDYNYLYDEKEEYDFIGHRGKERYDETMSNLAPALHNFTETILNLPELKKLYASNNEEKFDLVLLEIFILQAFLPLGVRFNAPIVGIASCGLLLNSHYGIGNPILPSHPSHWELFPKVFGSFAPWQRLDNFIRAWRIVYFFQSEWIPKQQAIAKKYFGNDVPSLHDLQKNVSVIFVNEQLPISFARPNLPHIIGINSFHAAKQIQPLPKDLQKILDEATQGFVYMSLGSNIRSKTIPDKLRAEFVAAFSNLPYKVIWKFENDTLVDKTENVVILKWTPQEAILAHPNIKVFIYQGGLQSTEEAIEHGVPLIGLPIMADQDTQVNKMVSVGVARKLEITTINSNELLEAIIDVATDNGYKQKMMNLRSILKDKPYDLLENAVWWTEHVIRHRGAPYLRSNFADLSWYQRQDMDIIAFLSAGSVIVLSLALAIFYKLIRIFIRIIFMQSSNRKIKVN